MNLLPILQSNPDVEIRLRWSDVHKMFSVSAERNGITVSAATNSEQFLEATVESVVSGVCKSQEQLSNGL